MNTIAQRNDAWYMEDVALADIARAHGTPCYVYSKAAITAQYQQYQRGFGDTKQHIFYSVKANSNLSILQLLKDLGAGFDIVSGGELARVLAIGADPQSIVFSGVGKRSDEIRSALEAGIACFNVESEAELVRIAGIASNLGVVAPVSLRVNPDVDAKTHPYISTGLKANKFGVAIEQAATIYRGIADNPVLRAVGVDCHIGSQLIDTSPFVDVIDKLQRLIGELETFGVELAHIDLGGGLGICYQDETPPSPANFTQSLVDALAGRPEKIIVEPGRSLVGNAGVLLTRVEYLKHGEEKNFCIVDAAMNDLIRPSLYDAYQEIIAVQQRDIATQTYDVVGPVCESSDFLGKERSLAVAADDVLAVLSSGAYGFVMASHYNSRPNVSEVLVEGDSHRVIRTRETIGDLLAKELECLV